MAIRPTASPPRTRSTSTHLNDRLAKLESALASLQGQVAALTDVARSRPAPPTRWRGADPGAVPDGNNVARGRVAGRGQAAQGDGNMINAIKLYREHTGVGLKEAKDAVEGML